MRIGIPPSLTTKPRSGGVGEPKKNGRDWTRNNFHLTVLLPVRPLAEAALRKELESLPSGEGSPLAATGTVHFGRWVLIGGVDRGGTGRRVPPELAGWRLLFTVVIDGDPDAFLDQLVAGAGPVVDRVWAHCDGYPGDLDPAAVVAWLDAHRVDNTLCFGTWPGPSVAEVRAALDLRTRLAAFAVEHQGTPAGDLQRAFHDEFARPRSP
jgi:hypothetical protein